jgi:hypothetical protein
MVCKNTGEGIIQEERRERERERERETDRQRERDRERERETESKLLTQQTLFKFDLFARKNENHPGLLK